MDITTNSEPLSTRPRGAATRTSNVKKILGFSAAALILGGSVGIYVSSRGGAGEPGQPRESILRSEVFGFARTEAVGVVWRGNASEPSSHIALAQQLSFPAEFNWCSKDGVSYCTRSWNQYLPQYCGSSWAHATISALADRIKIARKARGPDVELAVQHMLNCGGVGSCYGGALDGPYQWLKAISDRTGSGISYTSGLNYDACSSDSKEGFCPLGEWSCRAYNIARTCGGNEGGQASAECVGLDRYPNATIADYGSIQGRNAMMREISSRGPIACAIDANPLVEYETGVNDAPGVAATHVVEVVGWGRDGSSQDDLYWIVRNSWGEYWGEGGFARVKSGSMGIEESCVWAVPKDYTAPERKNHPKHCFEDGRNCVEPAAPVLLAAAPQPAQSVSRRKTEILSREHTELLGVVWQGNSSEDPSHLKLQAPSGGFPKDFTWCDKDGVNYCTSMLNQHIPQYCGSCWVHGSVSALGDRIKIARNAQGPDIEVSAQHVLSCGMVGSCSGGNVDGPYQFIKSLSDKGAGISYATSQPYRACSNNSSTEPLCSSSSWTCTPEDVAVSCGMYGEECVALQQYPNASISEYGSISGADAIMKEVYHRGPIACGIDANPLLDYTTGIINNPGNETDHIISVVGWGSFTNETDGKDGMYWIVRNSWGEYWGEYGFVRATFGSLKIEEQCSYAILKDFTAPERNNQVHCHEDASNCAFSMPSSSVVV